MSAAASAGQSPAANWRDQMGNASATTMPPSKPVAVTTASAVFSVRDQSAPVARPGSNCVSVEPTPHNVTVDVSVMMETSAEASPASCAEYVCAAISQ